MQSLLKCEVAYFFAGFANSFLMVSSQTRACLKVKIKKTRKKCLYLTDFASIMEQK